MLAGRGIYVDASPASRWVQKFGTEIAKRFFGWRTWRGQSWQIDKTYVRIGGAWCYLRSAFDQSGQLIDFRLTKQREAQAARAFLRQALDNARLYQPSAIFTDKASAYAKVIWEINQLRVAGDVILHCDKKWRNSRIESDHAALKRITEPAKGFQSL
jgi:IS6 family transposase